MKTEKKTEIGDKTYKIKMKRIKEIEISLKRVVCVDRLWQESTDKILNIKGTDKTLSDFDQNRKMNIE